MQSFKLWLEQVEDAIDIKQWKDEKWIVLAALYNASGILGAGFIAALQNKRSLGSLMDIQEAKQIYDNRTNEYQQYKQATITGKDFPKERFGYSEGLFDFLKTKPIPLEEGRKLIWDTMESLYKEKAKDPDFDVFSYDLERSLTKLGVVYDGKQWISTTITSDLLKKTKRENLMTAMDVYPSFVQASRVYHFDYLHGKPIKITLHPYQEYIIPQQAYVYSSRNSEEDYVVADYCKRVIDALRRTNDPGDTLIAALGSAQTDINLGRIMGDE